MSEPVANDTVVQGRVAGASATLTLTAYNSRMIMERHMPRAFERVVVIVLENHTCYAVMGNGIHENVGIARRVSR